MNEYRVFTHPGHPPTVVKAGFSWPAFIFGPFWFLLNRMWMMFLITGSLAFGGPFVFRYVDTPTTRAEALMNLLLWSLRLFVWFGIGKIANFLLGEELIRKGYKLATTVRAKSIGNARELASRSGSATAQ